MSKLRDELKQAMLETFDAKIGDGLLEDLVENVEAAVIRSLGPSGLVDLAKQLQQVDVRAAGQLSFDPASSAMDAVDKVAVSRWRWDEESGCYVLDPNGDLVIYDEITAADWMNSIESAEPSDPHAYDPRRVRHPADVRIDNWKKDLAQLRDEFTAEIKKENPSWTYLEKLDAEINKMFVDLRKREEYNG